MRRATKLRLACLLLPLCCLLLGGCWDYRGLNEIDLVTGIAVDKDAETDEYILTIELVDTHSSVKEGQSSAKYVESRGPTIFEALRNAKKRLINKLYGGNMQVLLISKQIAEEEGVGTIMEGMLQDIEPRETMVVAISQEESAEVLLRSTGLDTRILSYNIYEMVTEDSRVTISTVYTPLYKAYNAIKGEGESLALPVIHSVSNRGKVTVEINGIALFSGDKLKHFLSPEDARYYLFATDQVQGGAFSLQVDGSDSLVSMQIQRSSTESSVKMEEGLPVITVKVKTEVNVKEMADDMDLLNIDDRKAIEKQTGEFLEERISSFIKDMQTEHGHDCFGIGRRLYQTDPAQWEAVKEKWDELFAQAKMHVQVEAFITATGILKHY